MTDKRPHIKPEELAGLIRQYLAGELDDKAMHDLERQALNDPFLADAIEGYAVRTPDQTVHQQELASRLSDRIATRPARIRPMYYRWAAAAAILLLMFSAGWFLWEQQQKTPIAGVQKTPEAAPVFSEHGDTATPQTKNNQFAETAPVADTEQEQDAAKKARKINSFALSGEAADKTPADNRRARTDNALSDDKEPSAEKTVLQNKALAADKTTSDEKTAQDNLSPAIPIPARPPLREESPVVVSSPTPAANNASPKLVIRGKNSFSLNPPDSQHSALSEVVIVGYGAKKRKDVTGAVTTVRDKAFSNKPVTQLDSLLQGRVAGVAVETSSGNANVSEDMAYREPAPVNGFTAFENYLKTKTINPDNKYNGTVRVSFVVMPDGSLEDFRILRHLNDACDAEAIRVIQHGPAWSPASDRKPTRVKVRVKFTVEKNK
ncbi:energy transducer TonB [Chitinophaga arvensicola]|uniref:TonB family C-terminal domain-containing protein n=1 Tax=Chitinophaga arvensicola TaxID=29529 RepID=A0A1I0NYM3_9BACT|nr:TonB family protein [Chitinophaga arvensicola]SEW06784.1 TonB family C-terminal domain-containing protein [Chitinophaga arvensicola]